MLVSDNQKFWIQRIVVVKNKIGYIAFTHESQSMDDIEKCENTTSWKFGKEIEILKEVKDEGNSNNISVRGRVHSSADSDLIYSL